MINFLLLIFAVPGLVLLYFQWKIKGQQEQFIKAEAESLRKLQYKNRQFVDAGLFGLQPESSYLTLPVQKPQIAETRPKILLKNTLTIRRNRKLKSTIKINF